MSFALFLLVNAMLFIRPAEFNPALYALPIYEACILTCLVVSYPQVCAGLTPRALAGRPINACVVGMLGAIVLSHLANGNVAPAFEDGVEFLKLVLYFFLLVAVVDTPARLERFLAAVTLFALAISTLAVLHYHGIVRIPAIEFLESGLDDSGDGDNLVRRLGSTGLFADPNDMCLMLVQSMVVCVYQIIERRRFYWAVPLAMFAHAMMLTHSRGGFLGMIAALVVLLLSRYGRRAVPLGLLVLPAVFLLFGGRQTNINLSSGTGQSRVQLWLDGMVLFVGRPIFGIGSGTYADYAGHVAHNSFIHCYTELGLVGGTLFLGAFYLAFWSLVRLCGKQVPPVSPALSRQRPYVLAIVTGYAGGLMSLSCAYIIPTYIVLGLASIYVRLTENELGVPVARLDARLMRRLVVVSAAFVVAAQVVIRLLARVEG